MKRLSILFIATWLLPMICEAQYAPQALLPGSTAIHKDSSIIQDWADFGTVSLGWLNIADTTLGKVGMLNANNIHGKADGNIVSLGDGGEVIYYFSNPIINGAGFDFAVFENGFRNPADSNEAFLELAKVSVSNNGFDYYEFPAFSMTDTLTQIAGFGNYMDCRKIHNLAGKYILNYGTPFNLDDMLALSSIDINNIRYIKIKDVVGSIQQNVCTRDIDNNKINDPYPTPFPSAGFDLDALGIIHHKYPTGINSVHANNTLHIFPNPSENEIQFVTDAIIQHVEIRGIDGRIIIQQHIQNNKAIVTTLSPGYYLLDATTTNQRHYKASFYKK